MSNPIFKLSGASKNNVLKADSLTLEQSINQRARLTARLMVTDSWVPEDGQQVIVEQDAVLKFGGLIENISQQIIPGSLAKAFEIECVDYSRLLDWKHYGGGFADQSFYSIVESIWSSKLAEEGITLGGVVNPGPTIVRLQDGVRPITEWFRKLSTETGFVFRLDPAKDLYFGPLITSPPSPSPFSLTFGSKNWKDLFIRSSLKDYRNRQIVKTEYSVSGEFNSLFIGDGSTRDFYQLNGPFQGTPVVLLNGSPQTVGRWGHDLSGFDFYHDVEGWGIHRYPSQSAPAPGDEIDVTYSVRFTNQTTIEDGAEIAARAAIQGGSGIVEAVHEDRFIDNKTALDNRALALLRQHGTIPKTAEFVCNSLDEPGSDAASPGEVVPINLTDGPSTINEDFFIEKITSRWTRAKPNDVWFHQFVCTNVEPRGTPASPIERLVEVSRIGPDPETRRVESPEPSASATPEWEAVEVDPRTPLVAGDDLGNRRPVSAPPGFRVLLTEWVAILKIAPTGSATFRIQVSENQGSSWTPLFVSSPTFATGVKQVTGAAVTFAVTHLIRHAWLRYDVVSSDGVAAVLSFVLSGRFVPE